MKSGTGDDPFADDATDADESAEADGSPDAESAADAGSESGPASEAEDPATDASADGASGGDGDGDAADESGPSDDPAEAADEPDDAPAIPWVLRRSSVKADRPNVTQFFLRDETDRAERRFQSDVEEILDTDVYTLDLREAAYLVAMRHPDEVAAELRDWGYEYMG